MISDTKLELKTLPQQTRQLRRYLEPADYSVEDVHYVNMLVAMPY